MYSDINYIKHCIYLQIANNRNKNLYYSDLPDTMNFTGAMIKCINTTNGIESIHHIPLAEYIVDKTLREFCRINQYYSFSREDIAALKNIYANLFNQIALREISIEEIAGSHYQNLKYWLKETNPFSEKIYSNTEIDLVPVTCFEYDAKLQIEILHINLDNTLNPVLDIGCGTQGNLVNYLRNKGFEAYGIDRFADNYPHIEKVDWLEYDYGNEKWGIIISNLGFSNHFKHNHLRDDGNFTEYAKKYMSILKSLKPGGSFYYAPALPFIEIYLNTKEYHIQSFEIDKTGIKGTRITKPK